LFAAGHLWLHEPDKGDPMTRTLDFVLADVFTDRPFGGNPLAVFPRVRDLADETMQAIARELNLSETTFVFPPADAGVTCTVRIFTPGTELPFAGHPTIGTGCYSPAVTLARTRPPIGFANIRYRNVRLPPLRRRSWFTDALPILTLAGLAIRSPRT
jgi:hypothetical protein